VARVPLDADIVIALLDPGNDQHATAVAQLRRRLAVGDELLAAATVYAESIARLRQQAPIVDRRDRVHQPAPVAGPHPAWGEGGVLGSGGYGTDPTPEGKKRVGEVFKTKR
jgi:hypothetical protein